MRVIVQYFARLRELAATDEWRGDVPEGSTAADVWGASVDAHPALAAMTGSVSCAINAEFASLTTTVRDGDEIAFLPPVSGGAR